MTSTRVVTTVNGDVRGAEVIAPSGRGAIRFLGIPYAAAPVGDLRWRAPRAPAAWAGVRDATSFAPAAPQAGAIESTLPGFAPDGETSEDCLALNVWTPALDGRRPVLVWLPGGGYLSGATSQPVYDAARLADEGDVVVVTIAYRLGALGFLAVEGDGDPNCGLRDQLAALGWVREHATAFGGDPSRVTVMGESAGAGSILHLLASPRRGAAFDRAIAQSGQPKTLDRDAAATVAAAFARSLEVSSPDAALLRTTSVEQILAAQQATLGAMLGTVGLMPFAPCVDGDVCDGSVLDGVAAGRARDVAVVIGTTRDELSLFPDPRAADLSADRLHRRVAALGPVLDAGDVITRYRLELQERSDRPPTNGEIWDAARTDAMMRIPNLELADAHGDDATFVYRFDWEAPHLGAAHAVDLPFTFGTFDREGWGDVVGRDERAERMSALWRASWWTFAADGSPGSPWRPYDAGRPTTVFDAAGARTVADPASSTRRCWMT